MIAASRLANIGRTVMPYATWAAYAIQLGYVGYNLYHYYQDYLAQVERDQLSNTRRGLDETIELIVARRRRRLERQLSDQSRLDQDQHQEQTTTIEEQTELNQGNVTTAEVEEELGASSRAASMENNPSSSSANNGDNDGNTDQENSVEFAEQIDRDRQQQQMVDPLGGNQTVLIEDDDDDDVEVLSNGSLSLESTDSNRGIIKDMYSECFICARTLNDPNKQVATLPFCMHPFHKTCLDGVLKWHRKCPVCDFDIFSPI